MGIGPFGSKDLRIWGLQVQACGKAWLRGDIGSVGVGFGDAELW